MIGQRAGVFDRHAALPENRQIVGIKKEHRMARAVVVAINRAGVEAIMQPGVDVGRGGLEVVDANACDTRVVADYCVVRQGLNGGLRLGRADGGYGEAKYGSHDNARCRPRGIIR